MIYFDNAATTLMKPPEVARAVAQAVSTMGNPGRSGHEAARLAAEAVFDCRVLASELFDIPPERVVFTMNATHGLNLAIHSLVHPGDRVVISGFEHNAVTRTLAALNANIGVAGSRLFDTQYSLQSFENAIKPDTKAVIVNHVSNVFGFVQPLEALAELCAKKNIPLIVDAAQSAGVLPISAEKLRAAYIAMPGHKSLYGPQGSGLLLCGQTPEPLMFGGTGNYSLVQTMPEELPERVEAGTLNVPGICGLAAGLRYVQKTGLTATRRRENNLIRSFCTGLRNQTRCKVFCGDASTQIGAVSVVFDGFDCEEVAAYLADNGVAVRSGLHCAPLAHRSAGTEQTGTVRFSFSGRNTEAEVRDVVQLLQRIEKNEVGKL